MEVTAIKNCSILLAAEASPSEIDSIKRVWTSASCHLVSRPSLSVDTAPRSYDARVLLIGAGMSERAAHWARGEEPTFDLVIVHDEAALKHDALLRRCADVLIAPYDAVALVDSLERLLARHDDVVPAVYANIIGKSPQMRDLTRVMSRVARYDAPVLVRGETGTGKELVASGIHHSSARCDQPFVPVNCGALNDELLLAELFGYERGAFTDAKRSHRGLVAQAGGGVLFLDEIDSLSPRGQAALLRFLQEQEFRPLGSESVQKSDVRVITATNKDLAVLVAQGRFREDLYYRVHLLDVELPPLRAREGDIDVLAEHFLAQLSQRYDVPAKRLHPMTREWMVEYVWPGNVRELQNYLYRLFVLTQGSVICVPEIKGNPIALANAPVTESASSSSVRAFRHEKARAMENFERAYLQRVMKATNGNVSLAARQAGKERRAFRRLLKKHGIDRKQYESAAQASD